MWVNRGMPPFDPSRLTPRQKDELILDLSRVVEAQATRIAALEARLAAAKPPKTPVNSSLPPSRGRKRNRPRRPATPRRKRDGPGVTRRLAEQPDTVVACHAQACRHCGATVSPDRQRLRAQYDHIELPPVRPVVTRVRVFGGRCPGCRRRLRGTPPADMPPGSPFGRSVVAMLAYLHHHHAIAYERLGALMAELFGLSISEGAIASTLRRARTALARATDAITARLRRAQTICCDETGARVEGRMAWEWVLVSRDAVLHRIVPSRSGRVVGAVLAGHRPRTWAADRWSGQLGHAGRHQICLAHVLRDAQYAVDSGDAVLAPALRKLLRWAVRIGRRRDRLKDSTLESYHAQAERRLDALVRRKPPNPAGQALLAQTRRWRAGFFVFLEDRSVPATNNASERALRPSVVHRQGHPRLPLDLGRRRPRPAPLGDWYRQARRDHRSRGHRQRPRGHAPAVAAASPLSNYTEATEV
jgi:transposase